MSNLLRVFMDYSQITQIVNIVFYVIIALIVLSALGAMRKGIVRNSYKLIWNCVFIIIGVFVCSGIGPTIGTIDISNTVPQFTMSETVIVPTTVSGTLQDIVLSVGGTDPLTVQYWLVNEPGTIALIEQLVFMLISLVLFIIWMILQVTVIKFIGFIFYKLLIGPLFEKSTKAKKIENKEDKKSRRKVKEKKPKQSLLNKLISLSIGAVNAIVIACMFLSPLTSMVNTANSVSRQHRDDDKEQLNNQTYNDIMSFLEAYDNSILAQTFFITEDVKGNTIDTKIMNMVANGELNGEKIYFFDEINNILDIGLILVEQGAFNEDGTINSLALLNKDVLSHVLSVLGSSQLFTNVLSLAGNIALNYLDANEILETNNIDISKVNWSGELANINQIYGALYDAGIITNLDDSMATFGLPVEPGEERTSMRNALSFIDNSELLKQIVPAILHKYASATDDEGNPTGLGLYLTSNWEDYKNIRWGEELCLVYDFVTGLFDVAGININEISFAGEEQTPDETPKEKRILRSKELEEPSDEQEETILDVLLKGDKYPEVISLLTGIVEEGTYDRESCLLDSNIVYYSFDKLMAQVYGLLESTQEDLLTQQDRENFNDAVESLETKTQIKEEFNSMLYAVKYLVIDSNVLNGLDLENEEQANAIVSSGKYIDGSKLFTAIIPSVLENLTKELNFGESIPLTGADLNFRNIKFGTELKVLIDCYTDILDLSSSLGGESDNILDSIDANILGNVLKGFKNSKILNPEVSDGKVCNFYKILDIIFANESLKNIGFYPNSSPNYDAIKNWDTEIDGIATIFTTIKEQDLISLISTSTSLDTIDGAKIEILLGTIDSSTLISKTFGSILDNALGSIVDIESGVSFNYVTSWALEGQTLNEIITKFKTGFTGDISNIDWLNSDIKVVNDLLYTLSTSQMFGSEDAFGTYLHNLLKQIDTLKPYLKDYGSNIESYEDSLEDFTYINWKDPNEAQLEISAICNIIGTLQEIGGSSGDGMGAIANGSFTSDQLRDIIYALCDSYSFRTITINAIDTALKGSNSPVAIEGITLSNANTEYLLNLSNNDRRDELLKLPDIISYVEQITSSEDLLQSLDAEFINKISNLLTLCHSSNILNSLDSTVLNKDTTLTIFEEIINYVINQTGLKEYLGSSDTQTDSQLNQAIKEKILSVGNSVGHNSDLDGWVSGNNEIQKLITVFRTVADKGLTSFSNVMNDLNGDDITDLLLPINYSYLLHDAIPNLIKVGFEAIDSSLFNGAEPNYYLNNIIDEDDSFETITAYYEKEIYNIAELIDFSNFTSFDNISSINVNQLDNLFRTLEESYVFNTHKDFGLEDNNTRSEFTCFEGLVKYFISLTGLESYYSDASIVDSLIYDVTFNRNGHTWNDSSSDDEIDMLMNLIRRFQECGLVAEQVGNLSLLNEEQIDLLLSSINDSYLLHPTLGNMIKNGFESLDPNTRNDMFGNTTPNYYLENIDGDKVAIYDQEISILARLISFMNDGSNNLNNVKEINTLELSGIYDCLASSYIFNSNADYTLDDSSRLELTSFENLIYYSLSSTGLTRYYDSSASVDENNEVLKDRVLEVAFKNDYGWLDGSYGEGENTKIINLIDVYQSLSQDTFSDSIIISMYINERESFDALVNCMADSYVLSPIADTLNSLVGNI